MKKIIALSTFVVGLFSVAPAFAAANYIDLSSVSSTELLAFAGSIFTDLWVLVVIAIGLPLGFYVIRKVIAIIPKR